MTLNMNCPKPAFRTVSYGRAANPLTCDLLQMFEHAREALTTSPHEAGASRGGLAPWQERRVRRYLGENLEHSIHVSELAGKAGLSASHFSRGFKTSFGEPPHAYPMRLRLKTAKRLMLTTCDPLSRIALNYGMVDQSHLTNLFRRVFHDTPHARRRRNFASSQDRTERTCESTEADFARLLENNVRQLAA